VPGRPWRTNPRCNVLVDDWQAALVECEQSEELGAVEAAEMFAEMLAARGPVTVPASGLGQTFGSNRFQTHLRRPENSI